MCEIKVGDVVVPRSLRYYHGVEIPHYTVLQVSRRYSMLLLIGSFFSCPQWYPLDNFRKANISQSSFFENK